MLNEAEFLLWCKRLGPTDKAQAIVAQVRSRPPTRRVDGGQSNVPGRYPSRKMGVTIQFESHRVELPFVSELEHDATVLEYYDQPPSIPLSYAAANGRNLSVIHTPDFFVIRQDAAGWEECKTSEDLQKLSVKSPNRYCGNDDGRWPCPPGESYASTAVTSEFFKVFGVEPVAGRGFTKEEWRAGSGAAALISYSFWQSRYGGEMSALGKTLQLGGRALTIIGVLPPSFRFPVRTDIWFPANTIFRESTIRAAHQVQVIGKLKPGVTLKRAQTEMTAIGDRLEREFPPSNAAKNVRLRELRDDMVKDARLMLFLLLGQWVCFSWLLARTWPIYCLPRLARARAKSPSE